MWNTSFLEGVGVVGWGACWKSFVNYRHAERALQLFPEPLFNSCLLQSLHCASSAFIWSAHHACGIRHLKIMLKTLLMRHNNEGNRLPLVSNKRIILQDGEASFKQTGAQWSVSESTLLHHDEICESNWLYVVLQTWWKYTFKPFFFVHGEAVDALVDKNSQTVVDGVWTTFDVSNQKWRKRHSTCTCTLYTLI